MHSAGLSPFSFNLPIDYVGSRYGSPHLLQMDGTELAALIHSGEGLFTTKLLLASLQCLWVYDYLLNLGDEIKYAWSGRKSWGFALFVAIRYTPIVFVVWVNITMFHYDKPFCGSTKWVPVFHACATTALTQIAVSLRVFAITGKNKIVGGILTLLVAGEICYGIFSVIWFGLGPLQPFPEIDLDEFKICIYKLWTLGELLYYGYALAFDVFVFLMILVVARRPKIGRLPGIPSILDTLVRDATYYFLLIFSGHFLSVLFLFVAPVEIQLFPGIATTVLVPIMGARLMLSLKKASVEPKGMWTLDTMASSSIGRRVGGGTIRFATQAFGTSQETLPHPMALEEEGIELDAKPRPSLYRGSQQAL